MIRALLLCLIAPFVLTGCPQSKQIKVVTAVSRTVKLVPPAMKVACDGVLVACIAKKTNPCPELDKCQDAEKKIGASAAAVEQGCVDILNAIDLGTGDAASKLLLVVKLLGDLDGLLKVWGVDVVAKLLTGGGL